MCLWLEELCFSLISYAMLFCILRSCIEQASCLHISWETSFYHNFSESFIYSTAILNSIQSKADTSCLLPCIPNHAAFLQRDNKHQQLYLRHFGSAPVLISFQIISTSLSGAVKSRVIFVVTTLQLKFQCIFHNPVFITDNPHCMKA